MQSRIVQRLTALRPARISPSVVALAVGSVAVGTIVIAILEQWTGIPDASAVYLVVVVIVGSVAGTTAALGTAVVAFLVYDILFTEPRLSLVVADPIELLNLVLVLIVALAVGRLAALGASAPRRPIDERPRRPGCSRSAGCSRRPTRPKRWPARSSSGWPATPGSSASGSASPAAATSASSPTRARVPSPAAASSRPWSGPRASDRPAGSARTAALDGPRHAQDRRPTGMSSGSGSRPAARTSARCGR